MLFFKGSLMELRNELNIFVLIISAILISLFVNIFIIFISKKFHLFIDKVDNKPQGFHISPTARAGGIGIFFSFGLIFWNHAFINIYFLISLSIVFLSGLIEDFSSSLSPKIRLLLQFIGVGIGVIGMNNIISDLSPIIILPYYLALAFSLFGIIGVCNAINIIDGFNGLASGIVFMAGICIALVSFGIGENFIFYISLIVLGGVLGFLILNFPKGKIFLGDGGAYMLGFLMAFLLGMLTKHHISAWFGLFVMIYPVWEVIFSIYRRKIKRKTSAMKPDRLHFHTLLYKRVFKSNPITSMAIWIFNLPFMIIAVIYKDDSWVLISGCIVFILIYGLIYRRLVKFKLF